MLKRKTPSKIVTKTRIGHAKSCHYEDVLNKINFASSSSQAFIDRGTAAIENLYLNGGAQVQAMLDAIAADSSKNYQIQFFAGNAVTGVGVDSTTGLLRL